MTDSKIEIPEQWRRKYFEIERAHSNAVDKIGELTSRLLLRERELAERGSDRSALEEKVKGIRRAYDKCSQDLHDCGLAKLEALRENERLKEENAELHFHENHCTLLDENTHLKAEVESLKAPVSDEECVNFGWMIGDRYRFDPENVDAMIANRAKPQKEGSEMVEVFHAIEDGVFWHVEDRKGNIVKTFHKKYYSKEDAWTYAKGLSCDERIKELEAGNERLKEIMDAALRGSKVKANEREAALEAENARLKAPVSDEEYAEWPRMERPENCWYELNDRQKTDVLIAHRAKPQKEGE